MLNCNEHSYFLVRRNICIDVVLFLRAISLIISNTSSFVSSFCDKNG